MGAVGEYIWAVFANLWWVVTAILFALEQLLGLVWPNYRAWVDRTFPADKRWKFVKRTVFVAVLVSGFLAWKDEHERVGEKQETIDRQAGELKEALSAKHVDTKTAGEVERLTGENEQLSGQVARLEALSRPRELTDEQRKKMVEVLKEVPPGKTYKLSISVIRNCDDCWTYAGSLHSIWSDVPGWSVDGPWHFLPHRWLESEFGKGVFANAMRGCRPEEMQLIESALRAADIGYTRTEKYIPLVIGDMRCTVLVGRKKSS
jgi:hypothetical protein